MEHKEAEAIFKRYLEGTCSDEEKAMVESWDLEAADRASAPLDDEVYQEIKQRAWTELQAGSLKPAAILRLWPKIVIAAAAVAVIVFGVWFFSTPRHPGGSEAARDLLNYANDIAPGKNTATLTLGDGKVINLSDAKSGVVVGNELKYNDGTVVISDPALRSGQVARDDLLNSTNKRSLPYGRDDGKVQMLTATTPRGGMYQVVLPDGSHVWLNADTKISFPAQFIGKERRVSLIKGEAYFEISKDKARPFLVKTALQEVEVLGTHFNINAYPDEANVKTTLLEGSVRVKSSLPAVRDDVVLKSGEQAAVGGNVNIVVKKVDVSSSIAWQEGRFAYNNTPMEEVMRQVCRWYDIAVVYESAGLKQQALSGSVNRYEKLSGILNALKYTSGLNFKIENRTVIVMDGK